MYYDADWVPDAYYDADFLERFDYFLSIMPLFRRFSSEHLFANTQIKNGNIVNRHEIFHGLVSDYGTDANFYRAWSVVEFLGLIATFHTSGVSAFAPDSNNDSKFLTLIASTLGEVYQRLCQLRSRP